MTIVSIIEHNLQCKDGQYEKFAKFYLHLEGGDKPRASGIGERHASARRYKNEAPEGLRRSARRIHFRPREVIATHPSDEFK